MEKNMETGLIVECVVNGYQIRAMGGPHVEAGSSKTWVAETIDDIYKVLNVILAPPFQEIPSKGKSKDG